MCGIAGIFGGDRAEINRMLDAIRHRGPDARGVALLDDCDAALGHVRLSILDLDRRSNQPFHSSCGRYVLSYNGEIYNYLALKDLLIKEGCEFRTTSDTEVLLWWLIRYGGDRLTELDGMFSFCFVDRFERTAILARDCFGEKPLYYSHGHDGRQFSFCSEIKGLLQLRDTDRSLDPVALVDYLRFLYTAPPNTFYQGVRELPHGHMIQVDLRDCSYHINRYYDIESNLCDVGDNRLLEASRRFRSLFDKGVAARLQSDVPVCVYLSSGLDSNSILASAVSSKMNAHYESFTIRYGGASYADSCDESQLASMAAAFYGSGNTAIDYSLNIPFVDVVEKVVDIFDQPFGNSTCIVSEMLAMAVARGGYKVALVGDGGDEIAVGYPRYKALLYHKWLSYLPSSAAACANAVILSIPKSGAYIAGFRRVKQFVGTLGRSLAESFLDWSTYLNTEALQRALGLQEHQVKTCFYSSLLDLFRKHQDNPLKAASIVDLMSFVPYNLMQCADRSSMLHSIELRSPFLAKDLIHYSLGLNDSVRYARGKCKPLIREAYADSMPPFILRQRKRPFNPPIYDYVQCNIAELREYLVGSESCIISLIDRDFISEQIDLLEMSKADNSTLLWGLAVLECWLRR